jgi:hypothetical protein
MIKVNTNLNYAVCAVSGILLNCIRDDGRGYRRYRMKLDHTFVANDKVLIVLVVVVILLVYQSHKRRPVA